MKFLSSPSVQLAVAFVCALFEALLLFKYGILGLPGILVIVLGAAAWWLGVRGITAVATLVDMAPGRVRLAANAALVPGLNIAVVLRLLWLAQMHAPETAAGQTQAAGGRAARRAASSSAPASAPAAAAPADPLLAVLPAIKAVGMTPGAVQRLELEGVAGFGDADRPVFHVTPDGFGVVYLVDRGDHFTWLTQSELASTGKSVEQMHMTAVLNLGALASGTPGTRIVKGACSGLMLNGQSESSLLLLEAFWDREIAQRCPNGTVVSIAARDICAFCDAADAAGVAMLRKMGPHLRANGTPESQLITDELFVRRNRRWEPLPA